jgi:hypothetical protein
MKTGIRRQIREALAKDHACYVLITCSDPSEGGMMNVEMTYEGDPTLAAYLLQSAQSYIDDDDDEEEQEEAVLQNKIRRIE